jgi:beta-glucanase (GH16 family)
MRALIARTTYSGTPYTGTPIPLPRMFEAENFDKGGQGVGYNDNTAGNSGGQYRPSESVDIQASRDSAGGGYVISWVQPGEWTAYTVNVPASGLYDVSIRASNASSSAAAFHVEVDGANVTGSIPVSSTGSWTTFQWFGKKGVHLGAGKRVLKLVADAHTFDVNQISVLSSATPNPTPAPGPTPAPTPSPVPIDVSEPAPIRGMGYRPIKNWDFVNAIRDFGALGAEFHPKYTWGGSLGVNGEWQEFQDFNTNTHRFSSEGLELRAYLPAGKPLADGNIHSGMLRAKWTGQYGYFEATVKVPNVPGAWPAFWLLPTNNTHPPEIDIMEIVVGTGGTGGTQHSRRSFHHLHPMSAPHQLAPTYRHPNTVVGSNWREYWPGGINSSSFDFAAGFHKFAVIWEPGRLRHYVDDVLVYDTPYQWNNVGPNTTIGADAGTAQVLINYAVGGHWPGAPVASSLPSSYIIKNVQIWQK